MRSTASQHPLLSFDITRFTTLWLAALLATVAALLLTGCGMGPRLIPSPTQSAVIHGHVHGGQQPIVGANVYLLAAGTAAYRSLSVSLLDPTATGASDSIGAYVVTDTLGDFTLSGDYTCTAGQQVYVLVHGGDSGGGTNSAIGLMAVLGDCPALGTFAAATPFIEVNEVSTVAAAYALSGFATSDKSVSDDETDTKNTTAPAAIAGMSNAFATASNLADLATGVALATTPTANGTVPQATINTLANILAACVNTADPVVPPPSGHPGSGDPLATPSSGAQRKISHSTACNTLLQTALTAGTSGASPGTTAGAAINIAHNPTANISTLYPLASTKPPFTPALDSQPADFTITLAFTPTELSPSQIAFDTSGNLWYFYFGSPSGLAELNPLGAEAPGSPFSDAKLDSPFSIAIDTSGNLWTADYTQQTFTEFNSSGTLLQSNIINGFNYPTAIAIDPSGNFWVANQSGNSVTKLAPSGTLIHTFTNANIYQPGNVLSDGSGNIWVPDPDLPNIAILQDSGAPSSFSPLASGGFYPSSNLQTFAFDSFTNLWFLNTDGTIGGIDGTGAALPGTPFNSGAAPSGDIALAYTMTLDGQSNIWSSVCFYTDGEVHSGAPQRLSARPHDFDPSQPCSLYGFSSSGTLLLGPSYTLSQPPSSLAVDPSGNLWYAASGQAFYEIVGLAAPVVSPLSAAVTANKIASLP
jgi:streptogramin lyase